MVMILLEGGREGGREERKGGGGGQGEKIGKGRGGREILGVHTLLSYQTKWSPYPRQN